jgi:predicted RNA-binding Zn ribbon-like protein
MDVVSDVPYSPGPSLVFANRPELLDDLDSLRRLLAHWTTPPAEDPSPVQLARLRRLRETLRALGEIVAGGRLPTDEELAPLNGALAEVPLSVTVANEGGRLVELPTTLVAGWDGAIRELAGRFASLLVHADTDRLKLCENPDCRRLFFDTSKNRAGRWCDETCGNRMRVRRFRAAQQALRNPPTPRNPG